MQEINENLTLEYNTSRHDLTISEHGRHIHKLVAHAKSIEDDEYRQHFVEATIDLMQQMNPQNKNVAEYRERLWKHLFRIANYDIKVTPPEGVNVQAPSENAEKEVLPYPKTDFKYRHYGFYIQNLIEKAIKMEDEEKKAEFVKVIAFYMKLAYRTWNRDNYVTDETIKSDLKMLSKGRLQLEDDHIIHTKNYNKNKRRNNNNNKGRNFKGRNNNNKGRNNYRKK